VKNKTGTSGARLPDLSVYIDFFPMPQHLRFALWKIGLHAEGRFWQVESILYVECHSLIVS
jgi:hypothetical protein